MDFTVNGIFNIMKPTNQNAMAQKDFDKGVYPLVMRISA